jgi:adenylate cyclase
MTERQSRVLTWAVPLAVLIAVVLFGFSVSGRLSPALYDLLFRVSGGSITLPSLAGLERPALMLQLELGLLAIGGLGVVLSFARGRALSALGLTSLLCILALLLSWRLDRDAGLLFDWAYLAFAIIAVFLIGFGLHTAHVSDLRQQSRGAFGRHFASRDAERIARHPELLHIGGDVRTLSVLAVVVEGFSEGAVHFASPAEFRARGQALMARLAEVILEHRGMLEHVGPGTLTAIFNAPFDDPEHAEHACACALALDDILRAEPGWPLTLAAGIDTGLCVTGDFGANQRPSYAATGQAVERAGALQRHTAKYGARILVGDGTRAAAEAHFAFLEIDRLSERDCVSAFFALLGNPQMRASPKFRALQAFHDHIFRAYRMRDWKKARALIEQCRALSGAEPKFYDLYMNRIAHLEAHPPGDRWDGVFRPTQE